MKDLEFSDDEYEFPDEVSMDFPVNPGISEPDYPDLFDGESDFDDFLEDGE